MHSIQSYKFKFIEMSDNRNNTSMDQGPINWERNDWSVSVYLICGLQFIQPLYLYVDAYIYIYIEYYHIYI